MRKCRDECHRWIDTNEESYGMCWTCHLGHLCVPCTEMHQALDCSIDFLNTVPVEVQHGEGMVVECEGLSEFSQGNVIAHELPIEDLQPSGPPPSTSE